MKKYISIDIGGTAIKYGILSEDGIILTRSELPTEAHLGGPAILDKVIRIIDDCSREQRMEGICISTAGMVDTVKGEILHAAPLIPQYTGTRFKEVLEKTFAIPCQVENDVNCAGLAEYISGAGMGTDPMLMLTVGTGIGGCLIINGQVFHGFAGNACEVGYMHMYGSDFQTMGAASILTKKVASRKMASESEWNGYRIFQMARMEDPVCVQAIDEMVDVLGMGIANICYVVNPELVVLGGGIMAQESYLKERLQLAVGRYLIDSIADRTRLAFARHKNDAGMLGAFYHFMNCR